MERISVHQFAVVCIGVTLGFTFLPIGQAAAGVAGRDAWMAVVPAFAAGIPFGLMVLSLARRYPGQNFLQIYEQLAGKWVAKAVGLLYILITIYFCSLLLQLSIDTFKRSILPLVPESVFLASMILVFFLVWTGMEVFARFAEVVLPLSVISLLFILVFSLPRFEWDEFWPLLEEGIMPVALATVKLSAMPMEFILFQLILLPFLPQGETARLRTGIWRGMLFVGILNGLITLTENMVFGPEETARINYGTLILGKMVEISKTVAGVESVFMITLMGVEILKIGAFVFAAAEGLAYLTGFTKRGWLYTGVIVLCSGLAMAEHGGTWLYLETGMVQSYLVEPLAIGLVLVLWLLAHWRRGRAAG